MRASGWSIAFGLVAALVGEVGAQTVAFVGVHVIPMREPGRLADQTVVVENGVIARMGPVGTVRVPRGASVVDGRGRYLIPGLTDMHAHLLADTRITDDYLAAELAVMVANGVTTFRNPIGRPELLGLRDDIERGRVLGPRMYVAGHLAGDFFGGRFHGHRVHTPQEAVTAVRAVRRDGYDLVKLTYGITPAVYEAVVRTAADENLRVFGHVGPQVGLSRALAAGQQIEHLDQFVEALATGPPPGPRQINPMAVIDRIDLGRAEEVAAAAARAGVWVTPTQYYYTTIYGLGRTRDEIERSPDARFVSPAVREDLIRWIGLSGRSSQAQRARYVEVRRALVRALDEAGVRLLAGSDAPEMMMLYGFSLHRELEHLVLAGLTPYAALATATRNPADFLGASGSFGTVETGAAADLVLLAADPLEDITATRRIEGVVLRGRWLPRGALDTLLDDAAATLSRAPLATPLPGR